MSKHLLIVESPTKAKTISRFLPKGYDVLASVGHVKDLPKSATDIPKKYKEEKWARLGIDVDNNFTPLFVNIKGKNKIIQEMKSKLKQADTLLLATDEDREGESIAAHLVELLKPSIPIKRMVFHEITKEAIKESLQNPRSIDTNLVKAQETRRILDRLFGYKISELLWKKITYKLSAGRVQSPGLLLLVEKERERYLFNKVIYSDITAEFSHAGQVFNAKLHKWNDTRIAIGSDFDNSGKLIKKSLHLTKEQATQIIEKIKNQQYTITNIETKPQKLSPPAPFITSTLQQEANRQMKISARDTMRAAQSLYEQGYITYMRTDSYTLSRQAINATRAYISNNYSAEYLPEKPNFYGKKSKGAQEAHEAIRPSGTQFVHPDRINVKDREKALYRLIWQRTIASQMTPAIKHSTNVTITTQDNKKNTAQFNTNGSILSFPGFLTLYTYSKVDNKLLPQGLEQGVSLELHSITPNDHDTKPPSRYNDASLIKQLESLGIGRPSTYASIINTLLDRDYARRVDQALVPTLMGFAVIQFLEKNFPNYIKYEFTSIMEDTLDKIASGAQSYLEYLNVFYFGNQQKLGLEKKVKNGEDIDVNESQIIRMPNLNTKYQIRVGRFGPFIVIEEENKDKENFSLPADCNPSDLHEKYIQQLAEIKRKSPEPIGHNPDNKQPIYYLTGRFGPYVQEGEITEENPKPKRASVPPKQATNTISLELALKLLSVPRDLGVHPENQESIIAAVGRFGPYIKNKDTTRSLKKDDDVYTITLERALELLAEQPPKRRRASPLIKELGEYKKKKLAVYQGPYGYYLKHGTKNLTLPEDKKNAKAIAALTLEQAVEAIKKIDKE